ncbi:MAG: hypothetical protein R2825_27105 [Saprospiraceae bacterium]
MSNEDIALFRKIRKQPLILLKLETGYYLDKSNKEVTKSMENIEIVYNKLKYIFIWWLYFLFCVTKSYPRLLLLIVVAIVSETSSNKGGLGAYLIELETYFPEYFKYLRSQGSKRGSMKTVPVKKNIFIGKIKLFYSKLKMFLAKTLFPSEFKEAMEFVYTIICSPLNALIKKAENILLESKNILPLIKNESDKAAFIETIQILTDKLEIAKKEVGENSNFQKEVRSIFNFIN